MKILALELSTARGSLAWLDRGREVEREWPNDRKNSGPFFENVQNVVATFGSPEIIVVGLGPGSYAGTRIAISAAIGLQASSGAHLIGFQSICAMESDAHEYCIVGDARRRSFFFARVREHNLLEGPDLLTESELRERIDQEKMPVFATEELPQFNGVQICYPSSRMLARLAADANRAFVLSPLEPIYLREPHITTPGSKSI